MQHWDSADAATLDYTDAFQTIQSDKSSTFGPRVRASCNCYDFHRGIDIHGNVGDPVLASFNGVVTKIITYSSGGLTVVLEHSFEEWTKLHPDKGSTKRWYTLYMHLDDLNGIAHGDVVTAGQHIAFLGESGSTVSPHLHHEVRVGTRCSLEWAINNPSSKCNTRGYDPHVHPMLVYPASLFFDPSPSNALSLQSLQEVDKTLEQNGIVYLSTSDKDANVNRYVIEQHHNVLDDITHTLDFNLRSGFDATSTAALDTPNQSLPYLDPIVFGYRATDWETHLVIPHEWVLAGATIRVDIFDTWGNMVGTLDL